MQSHNSKNALFIWVTLLTVLFTLDTIFVNTAYVQSSEQTNFLIKSMPNGDLALSDFVGFYYAGKIVDMGQAKHSDDYNLRMKISNIVVAPHTVTHPLYWQYPAFVSLLMAPFATLPLLQAYYLWCLLTVTFGIICSYLFLRQYMQEKSRYIILFILMALGSLVSIFNVYIGQAAWLLVGLNMLFFLGLLTNRDKLGGIALALTTFKPQYSLFYVGASVGLRRWHLLGYALLTEAILFFFSLLVFGWHTLSRYPQLVTHTEIADPAAAYMISIRPVLEILLPHLLAIRTSILLAVLAAVSISALWSSSRNSSAAVLNCSVAITVLTALIFSPHANCHDALLLAIPAAVIPIDRIWRQSNIRWWGKIWAVLISVFPLAGFLFFAVFKTGTLCRLPFFFYNVLLFGIALTYLNLLKKSEHSAQKD